MTAVYLAASHRSILRPGAHRLSQPRNPRPRRARPVRRRHRFVAGPLDPLLLLRRKLRLLHSGRRRFGAVSLWRICRALGRADLGRFTPAPAPRNRARLVALLVRRLLVRRLTAGGALRASPFDLFVEIRDGFRPLLRAPRRPQTAVIGACEVRTLAAALLAAPAHRLVATLLAFAEVPTACGSACAEAHPGSADALVPLRNRQTCFMGRLSFIRASVIAARKFLHVSGGFGGLPPAQRGGGGTPKGAPWYWAAACFPDCRETEAHGNAFQRPAAATSSTLGPDFRARARASSPSRQVSPPFTRLVQPLKAAPP